MILTCLKSALYAYILVRFLGRLIHCLEDLRNFLKTRKAQTRHLFYVVIDADALKKTIEN